MIRPSMALAAALAFSGSGCSDPSPSDSSNWVESDSSGARIVTSPFNPDTYALLSSDPTWSVGGVDAVGPTQFSDIGRVYGHPDGNVWVSDRQSRRIEVFGHDGGDRFGVGGAGDGPTEFRRLRLVGGDSAGIVVALDAANGKVLRYAPDGSITGSVSWSLTDGFLPNLAGVAPDGDFVGWLAEPIQTSELEDGDVIGDSVTYLNWSSPSAVPSEVHRVEWPGSIYSATSGGAPIPFRVLPGIAIAGLTYFTSGSDFQVLGFRDDSLVRIVRLDIPPVSVGTASIRWYRQDVEARTPPGVRRQARLDVLDDPRVPDQLPAFDGLLVDDEGQIWARRWSMSEESDRVWEVFGVDGVHLGHVPVPGRFSPSSIRGQTMIGVWTDELDVPHLRSYRLTRTS